MSKNILEYIICLDNGHGEDTPGKCSPDKKLKEYAYAREIVNILAKKLRAKDIKIYIVTPELTDISLRERCRRINKVCRENNNKVISISIHCNAAGSGASWNTASGWSVFVSKNASQNSKRLALCLYQLAKNYNLQGNRSVPKELYWVLDLAMCRDTLCPAILTENMFLDNKQDVEFLLSEKGKLAIVDVHYNGILKYFE